MTPATDNSPHFPEEIGPSDDRKLVCCCGNPDPAHMDNPGANVQPLVTPKSEE